MIQRPLLTAAPAQSQLGGHPAADARSAAEKTTGDTIKDAGR